MAQLIVLLIEQMKKTAVMALEGCRYCHQAFNALNSPSNKFKLKSHALFPQNANLRNSVALTDIAFHQASSATRSTTVWTVPMRPTAADLSAPPTTSDAKETILAYQTVSAAIAFDNVRMVLMRRDVVSCFLVPPNSLRRLRLLMFDYLKTCYFRAAPARDMSRTAMVPVRGWFRMHRNGAQMRQRLRLQRFF